MSWRSFTIVDDECLGDLSTVVAMLIAVSIDCDLEILLGQTAVWMTDARLLIEIEVFCLALVHVACAVQLHELRNCYSS